MPNAAALPLAEFHAAVLALAPANAFQCLLRWDLGAEAIAALAVEIQTATTSVLDRVAAVPAGAHSWCTVMQPLADDETVSAVFGSLCDFPHHVSASKEIRDASTAADTALSAFGVECSMRVDVYRSVTAYAERYDALAAAAAAAAAGGAAFEWPKDVRAHSPEEQRLLDRMLRDFRRNGLHLAEAERDRLRALKTRMSELSITFSKNLGEEASTFELTPAQLDGMPADWMAARPKAADGSDKVVVDLKYPSAFPILKLCKVPETRALLERAFNSRCLAENTAILEELIRLRADEAAILGFATSSNFVLDVRMAKKTESVVTFLEELSVVWLPLARLFCVLPRCTTHIPPQFFLFAIAPPAASRAAGGRRARRTARAQAGRMRLARYRIRWPHQPVRLPVLLQSARRKGVRGRQ